MVMSAPGSSALARRISLGSSTVIWLAPPSRRCITVSSPMGPAPTTTARRPTLKPERETPRNATAIGSTHAPSSSETSSGRLRSFPAGTLTYAAMPPLLPMPAVPPMSDALHRLDRPSRHSGPRAARVAFGMHGSAVASTPAFYAGADGYDLAREFMPDYHAIFVSAELDRVEVGAADTGVSRAEQHFARIRLGHRAFLYGVSAFLVKNKSAHCMFSLFGSLLGLSIRWAAPVS